MKTLRKIGFGLVFLGTVALLSTFVLESYQVNDDTIAKIEKKFMPVDENGNPNTADQGYQRVVGYLAELESIKGDQKGKFAMIGALNQGLSNVESNINSANEANGDAPDSWQWDGYASAEARLHTMSFAMNGPLGEHPGMFLALILALLISGAIIVWIPMAKEPAGIKNNGIFQSALMKKWGWAGILFAAILAFMYCLIYWAPYYLTNFFKLADPVAYFIKNTNSDRWFWYGMVYTILVTVFGVRMVIKYRHVPYQLYRTGSVTFFQVCFAFTIPNILESLNLPGEDLKNIWPLDYDFLFDYNITSKLEAGTFGIFLLVWGIFLFLVAVPLLTHFFGKRWYCSWVCGCGGLAETAGDPFRQQSDKSMKAWKFERWTINSVLVIAVLMTVVLLIDLFFVDEWWGFSYQFRKIYGFAIGSVLAGVIGTGLYPVLGNRPWCRFFCPLAATLGLIQKFKSRFRITTNGGQCISCGNCSTYCEQGIDVKAYAQRGENIVRSSCVGCGVCSAVCPRGVLKLENGSTSDDRSTGGLPISIGKDEINVNV